MGIALRHELRLEKLRERLIDRPNNVNTTVQLANLEYFLGLYDEAERSIARAFELGHTDDGSMWLRLARIFVRRHIVCPSNSRYLAAALEAFGEALKFKRVNSRPMHYLEVTSVYLKMNETQKAANVLAVIIQRWPQTIEAALAMETSAQFLLVRGQTSEALPYYKELLTESLLEVEYDATDGDDRAEVELPAAGLILGGVSVFLQMGLCYDVLGHAKLANEAYRQTWNTLLEQRDKDLARDAGTNTVLEEDLVGNRQQGVPSRVTSPAGKDVDAIELFHVTTNDDDKASNCDELGKILRRARVTMGIDTKRSLEDEDSETGRSLGDGDSETGRTSPGVVPTAGPSSTDRFSRLSTNATAFTPPRSRGGVGSASRAAAEEKAVRDLAFKLWYEDPYTWFWFGKVLLNGGCHALAFTFLDKAVGLLPRGLMKQEQERHLPVYMRRRLQPGEMLLTPPVNFNLAHLQLLRAEAFFQTGRFEEAYYAAKEARDLEPFGKAVRRLCPRLMALHNDNDRSQYIVESLAAARLQRGWRGHRIVRTLKQTVRTQIAALRIQRFMRDWKQRTRSMTLRLAVASAMELSGMLATCMGGMGQAARAASKQRLGDLARSALLIQRSCRVLLAQSEVSRRRKAISTLQAMFRGCKRRWEVAAALQVRHRPSRQTTCAAKAGSDDNWAGHVSSTENMLRVGAVTRRNAPMDKGCATGFGLANRAAFLWETGSYTCADDSANDTETPSAHGDSCKDDHSDENINIITDGAVFELSAIACCSMDDHGVETQGHQRWRSDGNERCKINDRSQKSLPPPPVQHWAPPAVAPEAALTQALRCSTLVISSPSFDSASACRLFSRVGLPIYSSETPVSGDKLVIIAEKQDTAAARCAQEHGNWCQNAPVAPCDGCSCGASVHETSETQGGNISHLLVQGGSPLGDTGLSVLSSAMRSAHTLSRLITLVIGGPGCTVGPRGITALGKALSSPSCPRLRCLSLSNCCLGRQRHSSKPPPTLSPLALSAQAATRVTVTTAAAAAAHEAWDIFFRHLQRMPALLSLSLQGCGLGDRDIQSAANAIQILPSGALRCLRLGGNRVGASGLRMLLRALTSRRMRLPALWVRRQRPPIVERDAREVVYQAFKEGLLAEVEFERPRQEEGGRSRLALVERTAESENLGRRSRKDSTSHIYV